MYDRVQLLKKVRELGVDVPDELPDRWVEVVDDHGTVIKRWKLGHHGDDKHERR